MKQIDSLIEDARAKKSSDIHLTYGMQTLDWHLAQLVRSRTIIMEAALAACADKQLLLDLSGV